MAIDTFAARTVEVADIGSRVTAETRHSSVTAHKRETRARVARDLSGRLPIDLLVAISAVLAELAAVDVLVTSGAALHREFTDRSAIVVTAQALGGGMRAGERHTRFFFVVEDEVTPNRMPRRTLVTNRAVAWKRTVRNDRTARLLPRLRRNLSVGGALRPVECARQHAERERQCKDDSARRTGAVVLHRGVSTARIPCQLRATEAPVADRRETPVPKTENPHPLYVYLSGDFICAGFDSV